MKKIIGLLLIIFNISCNTIKVKENTFKESNSNVELGALGKAKSTMGLKNTFTINAFPTIDGKIKLDLSIVPFTKKTYKSYQAKGSFNQQQTKINYVDSLPIKPEMVSIKIADISSMVSELNKENNEQAFKFIKNDKRTSIISSVLLSLSQTNIDRLRQADTYYLVQTDVAKYHIALYKSGKKVELMDISDSIVLGYNISKFCWFENERGKWQIADIVEKGYSCKGNTYNKIKQRKEKSLNKM